MVARRCVGSSSQAGAFLRGVFSDNVRTSSVGRSRNLSCPRVRMMTGSASLSMWVINASGNVVSRNITVPPANAEVTGDDLPVVLRHRHGHDLVRAVEEGRKGRGHGFRPHVELGKGQRFPGVRNL